MDDEAGEWIERGPRLREHRRVAAHHQGERPLLGAGRTAREWGVEVARTGGAHPVVLGPLDLGVDRRAVDHGRARAQRRQHGVDHLDHLGRVGDAQDDDVRPLGHTEGGRPVAAPCDTAASMGPRLRDVTVTSCPAARRWPAMGSPMAPSPMNPMRMACLLESLGGAYAELGQPRGGARQELVDHDLHHGQIASPGERVEGEGLGGQCPVPSQGRIHRQLLGGHVAPHDLVVGMREFRPIAPGMPSASMTQTDSTTASGGRPGACPAFGTFTGASKGSPVSMA